MPLSVSLSLPPLTVPPIVVGPVTVTVDPAPSTPSTPSTPTTPEVPAVPTANPTPATSKATWAMQMGETILVNARASTGPSAWVQYKVVYVFADGNSILVREPDLAAYTGPLLVAYNLRRQGETYADSQ